MKTETIDLSTPVLVRLNRFGHHILNKHTDTDTVRAFVADQDDERARARETSGYRRMQLWELFQIFGPHIRSSMKWPFQSFEFDREPDGEVAELEARIVSYAKNCDAMQSALIDLGRAIGSDFRYCSNEEIKRRVGEYTRTVLAIPDIAGQWWLRGKVVTVLWIQGKGLVVKLGNNSRKPVESFPAEDWGGPAIRDPRVVRAPAKPETDEDPF